MRRFPFDISLCLLTFGITFAGLIVPAIAQTPLSAEGQNRDSQQSLIPRLAARPNTVSSSTATPEQNKAAAQKLWASNTQSAGENPIEVARIGEGETSILFLGSIYGNDPESVQLMDRLVQIVSENPPPSHLSILLVRTPNPDGFRDHMKTNAKGVDLNRNFPSSAFTPAPNRLTGPHPASEAETQYLIRILKDYKPARVVHVQSSISEKPLLLTNDRWAINSQVNSILKETDLGRFRGVYKAGSLEEYVAMELQTPIATLQLPYHKQLPFAAEDLIRFATLNYGDDQTPSRQQITTAKPVDVSVAPANETRPLDGAKGNVDVLPPPPVLAPTSNATQKAPRFEELPAPPPRKQ